MQVIFDNGGGVTLQTEQGVYTYDDGADAAADVQAYIKDGHDRGWESAGDACRIDLSSADVTNGGYRVYDMHDVIQQIASKQIDSSWRNVRAFFSALGCEIVG